MSKKTFMNRFESNGKTHSGEDLMGSQELHISSFIVYCKPSDFEKVKNELAKNTQIEVFGEDASGKFVVVIEGTSRKRILDAVERVTQIPFVFNTAMVYHQVIDNEEYEIIEETMSVVNPTQVNTELKQLNY